MSHTVKLAALVLALAASVAGAEETKKADPVAHAWQIIDEATKSGDAAKRREIATAASLGGPREKVFAYLGAAISDKELEVRLAACASLASLKDKRSLTPLRRGLADPTPEVAFCSAQALWLLGDPAGREVLLAVLGGGTATGSSYVSKQSHEAMSTLKSPRGLFSAAARVGVMVAPVPGLGVGIASVQGLTKDQSASGRAMAALAFAGATDAESLQALRAALKDKDVAVRAAAVHALALRNDPKVLPDLAPLLDDDKDAVRLRAAVAYLRLMQVKQEGKARRGRTGAGGGR